MFHLAAFYSSLPISSNYAQLAGVADGALSQNQANQYIAWDNLRIIGSHVQGVTTNRAQIQSPSLRNLAYPEHYPIVQASITTMPTGYGYQVYGDDGPRLLSQEAFGVYASENGTGASPTVAGLQLADRMTPAPAGPRITLVASSTITLVAQQWALGTLSFATQLAAGEYSVVGMEVIVDGANYARLLFPGGTNLRPGVPVQEAYGGKNWRDSFRYGRFGEFGRFIFNTPPQLEIFGAAAGAQTAIVLLDVVKTR